MYEINTVYRDTDSIFRWHREGEKQEGANQSNLVIVTITSIIVAVTSDQAVEKSFERRNYLQNWRTVREVGKCSVGEYIYVCSFIVENM